MKVSFMIWAFVAAIFVNSSQGIDVQEWNGSPRNLGGRNPRAEYTYRVDAKTLTSLGVTEGGDEAERWAGVHLKGLLTLQTQGEGRLWGQLSQVAYGQVHHVLPQGWLGPLPEDVPYQSYPAIERPFEYRIDEDGLVKELIVSKDTGVTEENLLKGLLSTLQHDTGNKHLQKKKEAFFDFEKGNGVYRKMETDVTGKCGTLYTVTPLPYEELQQFPYLAPFVQLNRLDKNERGQLLDITKTKDHADCEKRVAYHFGVPKDANWEKTSRTENNFMSRSTSYRIIVDRYNGTIYSANAISKVLASPMLYNNNKAMVVSSVNMTLLEVNPSDSGSKHIQSPRSAGGLIYSIASRGQGSNQHRQAEQDYSGSSENLNNGHKKSSQYNKQGEQQSQEQNQSQEGQDQQETKRRNRRSTMSRFDERNSNKRHYNKNQHSAENQEQSNDYMGDSQSREQGSNEQNRHSGHDEINKNNEKRGYKMKENQQQRDDGSQEQKRRQEQERRENQEEGYKRQLEKQSNSQENENRNQDMSQERNDNHNHGQKQHRHNGHKHASNSASDSLSSSSSESSDKWKDVPDMNQAPIENIYAHQEDQQKLQSLLVENLRKVAHEIAQELQNPNQMPRAETVSKLNILVRIVSQMDSKRLDQATAAMYDTRDNVKSVAWKLYRDAVIQSGTTPAYFQFKKWVQSRKIQGEEAAQAVTILPKSLRHPTDEMTQDFFEFSTSEIVEKQQFLNTTAVLAATKLINNMHVNNRTAHERYASHLYGRLVSKNNQIVTKKVLPTLEKKLRSAIERRDTHKAQVYIEAIGNVGHPTILRVFAPYLEGKKEVSPFLRTHMVKNLDRLAKLYPEEARNTLFNIFKNEGDDYETRVAAIFKLFRAHPTTTMLFQMAESTHTDSSIHVQSAIQSAIKYAASLHLPKHRDLARRARAALVMMSKKHHGNQYSGALLDDFYDEEMNIGFDHSFQQIGSLDSFFPKSIGYSWESKFGGWMKSKKIQSAISSVGQFEEMLKELWRQKQKEQGKKQPYFHEQKLGAEQLRTILNIKGDAEERLEANLFVKAFNQERFFAIDEDTLQQLPKMAEEAFGKLQRGLNFNYTKYYNAEDAVMMFPLVMGVPSYITYSIPTLVRINGNARVEKSSHSTKFVSLFVPKAVNMTGGIEILFARNIEGKIGFINTVGKKVQYITSGVVQKTQVHIPLNVNVDIDLENFNMAIETSLINEDRETDIISFSVSPYTSIQDKQSLNPVLKEQDTKLARKTRPQVQYKRSYGQETGSYFEVEATDDRVDDSSKWYKMISQNYMSAIVFANVRKHIDYAEYILRHDSSKSVTSKMIVTLGYGNNKRYRQGKGWAYSAPMPNDFPSEVTVGSHHRQQEMLQKVTQKITNARSSVLDIGVEFLGQKKAQYALTAAIASSPVDERLYGIFFFNRNSADGKQYQIYSTVASRMPRAPIDNYKNALEFDPRAELQAMIKLGEKAMSGSQISIHAEMQKTHERKEYVRQSDNGKQCERQMKKGNNLMPACRTAIIEANIMNHLKLDMTYKVGNEEKNITYNAYSMVRNALYPQVSENWHSSQTKGDKIELDMELNPEMDALNVTIEAPDVDIKFRDIPVGKYGKTIMGLHPTISTKTRLIEKAFGHQGYPTCVIDHNEINTFSNRSYEYTIGKSWNVAIQNGTKQVRRPQHGTQSPMEKPAQRITVLVRNNEGQKEVQINYRIKRGIEVSVQLYKGQIIANRKVLAISSKNTYELWDEESNSVVLTAYALPTGESVVEIDDNSLKVVAGSQRVLIQGGETFRNNTRGLCGAMNGEPEYDLSTPANCFLRNEQQFASTWALEEGSEEHVKALKHQAQKSPCIPRQKLYPSIHTTYYYENESQLEKQWRKRSSSEEKSEDYDDENGKQVTEEEPDSYNGIMTKAYGEQSECEVKKHMQIVQKNGEICITQLRQPACPKHCRPENITKLSVKAVCRSQNDEEFRKMRVAIQRGENLVEELKQHQSNRNIYFNAPRSCRRQ